MLVLVAIPVAGGALLAVTAPSPRRSDAWDQAAQLAEARGEAAGAVFTLEGKEQLAAVGGLKGVLATAADSVEIYDPGTGEWQPGPPLPEPRHHLATAGVGGTLYATGGASSPSDWTPRREVWRLSPGASSWQPSAPLPEGRHSHRLVAVDQDLYLVGGQGGSAVLRLDSLAPEQGWSEGADLPRPRDHLGAVVVDGEIWVIGGRDRAGIVSRVDIYDPQQDRWRPGPPLPEATSGAAVGLVNGWIVVSGGEDPRLLGGIIDRHWRLRPGESSWEPAPAAPLAVHGAADGVVEGQLVIAGGASRHGLLSALTWSAVTQTLAGTGIDPTKDVTGKPTGSIQAVGGSFWNAGLTEAGIGGFHHGFTHPSVATVRIEPAGDGRALEAPLVNPEVLGGAGVFVAWTPPEWDEYVVAGYARDGCLMQANEYRLAGGLSLPGPPGTTRDCSIRLTSPSDPLIQGENGT